MMRVNAVNPIRGPSVKAPAHLPAIKKVKIDLEFLSSLAKGIISLEIYSLVLDPLPETVRKNVVIRQPFPSVGHAVEMRLTDSVCIVTFSK
jgi:hypothetical protein